MTTREDLHRLVDELPEEELHTGRRYLEYLRNCGDPVFRAFMEAPEDDEALTPEEEESLREAWEEYRQGKARPWEEVRKDLAGD